MHDTGYIVFGTTYNRWIKPLIVNAPFFGAVLFGGYIRLIYHAVISALSAELAVIPGGYIRTAKPIATPPDSVGTGNHFLTGYNRSQNLPLDVFPLCYIARLNF